MFERRTKDIITQNEDLELLFTFEEFPVLMTCTNQDHSLDVKANLEFAISKSSGMVQGLNLANLDFLYSEAHVSGVLGNIWKNHHKSFAEFIHKYNRKNIIEIGGQHGILYDSYKDLNEDFRWTIIDPDPTDDINSEVNVIRGFFNENTIIDPETDCIVHSHFFEHLYEPNKFLKQIAHVLDGKMMIFSTPNLDQWLKNNYSQTLTFEHTYLFNEYYVKKLLSQNNLEIVDMKYYCNEHSIFYAVRYNPNIKPIEDEDHYLENKTAYLDFVQYKKNIVSNINEFTKSEKFYIFGAHVNTQFLINLGLDTKNLICLLDNSSFKQNKRLYGTNLFVKNPSVLQDDLDAIVIVDTGKYNEEIISSLLEKYPHMKAFSLNSFDK
jgi:2-polyprenyl-3-methyl-5-hydroxy-6-metoxy-1,4-benzoquinol methylase